MIRVKDDVFVRSPYTDFFGIEIPAPSKVQMPNMESPSRERLTNENLDEKMGDEELGAEEPEEIPDDGQDDSDSPDNFFLTGANQQARNNQKLPQISKAKGPKKADLKKEGLEDAEHEEEDEEEEVVLLDRSQIQNYQDFLKTCANLIGGRIEYQEKLTMPQAHRLLGTICRRKIQAQPLENKSYMKSPKLAAHLIHQSYVKSIENDAEMKEGSVASKPKPYMSNNTDQHFKSVTQVISRGIDKNSVAKS